MATRTLNIWLNSEKVYDLPDKARDQDPTELDSTPS